MSFMPKVYSYSKNLLVFALFLSLSCCSTWKDREEYLEDNSKFAINDPFETFNRAMFEFDTGLNFIIDPSVDIYELLVPEPGRTGISNILKNIRSPIYLTNNFLQADAKGSGRVIIRFIVNSTLGILGFFDVASSMGMPHRTEDFGQTLAKWGIGEGFFLYVPVLGPSNLRDFTGYIFDTSILDPVSWLARGDNPIWWSLGYSGTLVIDVRSSVRGTLKELDNSSIDFYAALRSAYRQNRNELISNGKNDYQNEEYDFD